MARKKLMSLERTKFQKSHAQLNHKLGLLLGLVTQIIAHVIEYPEHGHLLDLADNIRPACDWHADAIGICLQELSAKRKRASNRLHGWSTMDGAELPTLDTYTCEECWELFRFRKADLFELLHRFGWGGRPIIKVPAGGAKPGSRLTHYRAPAETILLVVLRRLAFPCRWQDLHNAFNCSSARKSAMWLFGIWYFETGWGNRVSDLGWCPIETHGNHDFVESIPLSEGVG